MQTSHGVIPIKFSFHFKAIVVASMENILKIFGHIGARQIGLQCSIWIQ